MKQKTMQIVTTTTGVTESKDQTIKRQTGLPKTRKITKAMQDSGIVKLHAPLNCVPDAYKGQVWFGVIDTRLVDGQPPYQRPAKESHLDRIHKEFHFPSFGIPVVSFRSGVTHTVDANHRRTVARRRGDNYVDALIWLDLTLEEEAKAFSNFNAIKLKCDKWREFQANLIAGDEIEHELMALCKEFKLTTPIDCDDSEQADIKSVTVLYQIYLKSGSVPFARRFLSILSKWGREGRGKNRFLSKSARNVQFQRGLIQFLKRNDDWSTSGIIQELKNYGMTPCDVQELAVQVQQRERKSRADQSQIAKAFDLILNEGVTNLDSRRFKIVA